MGAITRAAANNITTGGVILPAGINDASVASVTGLAQVSAGDGITLISSQTASNSASISFTSGLTSTYKTYKFVFSSIHAITDKVEFEFQTSTNGGSSYGVACTSTIVRAYHNESGSGSGLEYDGQMDSAQSTSYVRLTSAGGGISNDADIAESGNLYLFNPSDTTFVKHFIHNISYYNDDVYNHNGLHAGYFNTTSAINAIQFKMSSGNMDGTIYMYGIN
jgi:hypothetical protein